MHVWSGVLLPEVHHRRGLEEEKEEKDQLDEDSLRAGAREFPKALLFHRYITGDNSYTSNDVWRHHERACTAGRGEWCTVDLELDWVKKLIQRRFIREGMHLVYGSPRRQVTVLREAGGL